MKMFQITATGEQLKMFIGAVLDGGAKVVEIKDISPEFVTPQELAVKYGISEDTVRSKLASFNKGVGRKCKYLPHEADLILSQKEKKSAGRGRKN